MNLNCSVEELINKVGGSTNVDPHLHLARLTSLEDATEHDVAVVLEPQTGSVFDDVSPETIQNSNAALLIARKPVVDGKPYLLVDDPLDVYQKLALPSVSSPAVHERAVVHTTVILDEHVSVGPLSVLESHVRVGMNSIIGAHVFIGAGSKVGSNVYIHPCVTIASGSIIGDGAIIHPGAVIGSDGYGYHVSRSGLRKIPQIGIVRLGRNVEVGANTCIDRATFGETVLGDGVKLDNHVHIAHNVVVGPHSAIIAQTGVAGGVRIGAGCQIGGQVAIKDHITIGNNVKIVSKSAVMKDVPDNAVICGIPAMPFRSWKRLTVMVHKLPEFISQFKTMHQEVERYKRISWWKRLWGSY